MLQAENAKNKKEPDTRKRIPRRREWMIMWKLSFSNTKFY